MRIAKDCVVSIEFTLSNEQGKVLDRSPSGQPLQYLHGAAGILPELERHLAGKQAGDAFDLTIPPDRGFGDRQPALVEVLPRNMFPADAPNVAVGQPVTRTDPGGKEQHYLITAVTHESITVDGNHPLAGMTLRFQGKVVAVRAGTAEELAQS
jgi:FKBP-type peptidyl-prolyl cis-trans isomerase SlyD